MAYGKKPVGLLSLWLNLDLCIVFCFFTNRVSLGGAFPMTFGLVPGWTVP